MGSNSHVGNFGIVAFLAVPSFSTVANSTNVFTDDNLLINNLTLFLHLGYSYFIVFFILVKYLLNKCIFFKT